MLTPDDTETTYTAPAPRQVHRAAAPARAAQQAAAAAIVIIGGAWYYFGVKHGQVN